MAPLGLWLCHFVESYHCGSLIPFGLYYSLYQLLLPRQIQKRNPSAVHWGQQLGEGRMFNISILLISLWGESGLGKTPLQDQHEVDGHLVYSTEYPPMANTTHSLGSVS